MKTPDERNDLWIGFKILWSWNPRFWAWFASHGIQSAYVGGEYVYDFRCNHQVMIKAPQRVFDTIYHFGPLKIKFGVLK